MALEQGNEFENKELSASDAAALFQLLKEQQAETAELRKQLAGVQSGITSQSLIDVVRAVREGDKDEIGMVDAIRPDQIPEEDFDEKGVVFTCPKVGYLITGDLRKGFPIKLPYNMKYVFFEYSGNKQYYDQGGKKAISNISTFKSQSKKLTEWLRGHTLFNVDFYETGSSVMNIDTEKMRRTMEVSKVVNQYDPIRVMRECKSRGLEVGQDMEVMRYNLVANMVSEEVKSQHDVTQRIANETRKDELLLKPQG